MASVPHCQREYTHAKHTHTHTHTSISLCVSEFVNSDFISVYKLVSFNLPQKPEELSDSTTVSDESKQDSGSDQSADDTRGQTDDSDSGSAEEDTGLYRSHMSNTETTVADRLRELQLHRAMKEQLSINNQTHPLDTPTPDKGKSTEVESELISGILSTIYYKNTTEQETQNYYQHLSYLTFINNYYSFCLFIYSFSF